MLRSRAASSLISCPNKDTAKVWLSNDVLDVLNVKGNDAGMRVEEVNFLFQN